MKSPLLYLLSLLVATFSLAGCSTVHTKTPEGKSVEMNKKEFADYLEQVFRHHNSVVDRLLYSADAPGNRNSSLGKAEASMAFACLPINEVVSASAMGQTTSYCARMHLTEAVPECEAATRTVEQLISAGQ